MDKNNLGIEIQAELNKSQSRNNISNDIKNLEKTPFFIRLIAKLHKSLSKANIDNDIKTLEKSASSIRLNGRLNRATTRQNIRNDVNRLGNSANVTLGAQIDRNELQQSIETARNDVEQNLQNNPINVPVNINGNINNGAQQVQNLNNQMRNSERFLGSYITARDIFRIIANSVRKVVDEVEALNEAQTNLQIATSKSANEMKSLMQDYNQLAKQVSSTTMDTAEAADDWIRQGQSIADTNILIKDSLILSKIGQIESGQATEYLTSAMKGYKTEAKDVISIVDKLSAVDLESASNSGELAEAMSKTANVARSAGVELDTLIAYLATAKDITQDDASIIGNSFRSIFTRLNNIKIGKFLGEEGNDISGEINDAERVLTKFNISLRDNAKEFRNAQDIIADVANAWETMSSVEQAAVRKAFANTYQAEKFTAIMENYNKVIQLTEVSQKSAGTAMEKFSIYENSLEAATNRLTASLEGLAYNTIDAEFLKGLANATAGIVEFVDSTKLLKTGITAGLFTGAVAGLIAFGTRMIAVRNNVMQFTQAMNLSRSTTALTENQVAQLTGYVNGLSQAQLRCVLSSRQLTNEQRMSILMANGLSQAEAQAQLQAWNLVNATNAQTAATFSLRGAWEGVKASIASNPIGLIVTALTLATTVINNVIQKQKELRESISETAKEAKEQTDTLNDLIKSYEEFADKTSYTAEEKEKLKSIQEQLSESYHTEVSDIDLVNGKYDEQIEKLRELKKEKLQNAELSLVAEREQATKDSSYQGLTSQGKNKQFLITADWFKSEEDYNNIINEFDEKLKYAFSTDIAWASKWAGYDSALNFTIGNVEDRVTNLQTAMNILKDYGYSNIGLYSELNKLLSEYQGIADTASEATRNLADNMFQQYELDNPYNKVGKESYLAWKDGLLATAEGDDALQNELLSLAEKQFPDYATYFNNLDLAKKQFEAYEGTNKYNFLISLSESDLETALQIPNLFKDGLDGASKLIEDFNKNNPIKPTADTKSLEGIQKTYDELSKSASSYVSNQKTVNSALEEQQKYGQLSASTIQELTEAGYAQALVVDSETGAVTLNKQAYEQLNKEKKQAIILEAKQQKTDLEQKYQDEQSAISDLTLEMKYANEERRKAIALELAQHGQNMAEYADMIDKINSGITSLDAPTFEDKKKSSSDPYKDEAEGKIAEIKHQYEMEQISYKDYIDGIEKINQEYFANKTKYLDEYWKYQEEVYNGRKKLAEDYYNDRISDLESQIDIATKYSTDKDGNSLDAQEKFDYIRSTYQEILSEIDRRRNEIIQNGIEGHEDDLKELEQQYEKYVREMADVFKDEVESEIDYIQDLQDTAEKTFDDKIDKIEAEKKAMEDRYDAEIDKIDSVIDSLEKENDQKQLALNIAKAEKELAEAQRKRNVGVLQANGTISYQADPEAITEAQNNLNELYLKKTTEALKQQKELLQKNKEIESDNYDAKINNLKTDKEKWKDFYDDLVDTLNEYLNPKQKKSNTNVWNTVAGEDGAVKVGKVEMSTDQIDARINSDEIAKSLIEKFIKASNDEVKAKELIKNLDLNNAYNTLSGNSLKPAGLAELQKAGMFNSVSAQNYVNNNGQTVNLSIGDIYIQEPVGDTTNLAQEIIKRLPNAIEKQIHKVR